MNLRKNYTTYIIWGILIILAILIINDLFKNNKIERLGQECIEKYKDISRASVIGCNIEVYNSTDYCLCSIRECTKTSINNVLLCWNYLFLFDKNIKIEKDIEIYDSTMQENNLIRLT